MSSFWSIWITVITLGSIAGCALLLLGNTKSDHIGDTTGHVYDGIEEYDNPLLRWWLWMFIISIFAGLIYLALYPGLGNWKGLLGWTQEKQWQENINQAEARFKPLYAHYGSMSYEELQADERAMKTAQRLFANNCSVCHGSTATGAKGFPNLTDNDWLYGGEAKTIEQTITFGRNGAMPAWKEALGGDEAVSNVANYVMSLSGREVDQQKATAGKVKFDTLCIACHGSDGKGNHMFGAPNLTDSIWLYGSSEKAITQTIAEGRGGKMPAQKERLGTDKSHLLAAYIHSLSNK